MHFAVNKGQRLSSSLAALLQETRNSGECALAEAPRVGLATDIAVSTTTTTMTPPFHNTVVAVDRRLPRCVRAARRKRKDRFEDAIESDSVNKERSTKKKQRIVFCEEEEDEEDEECRNNKKICGSASVIVPNGNSTGGDSGELLLVSLPGGDAGASTDATGKDVSGSTVAERPSNSEDIGGSTPTTKATTTKTRVVTPVPAEPSESEGETSENSTSAPQPAAATTTTATTMSPQETLMMELLKCISTMRISRPRKNRYPSNSQFSDAVEELVEDDDDDASVETTGSGQGQQQSDYPEAATPLYVLFCKQVSPQKDSVEEFHCNAEEETEEYDMDSTLDAVEQEEGGSDEREEVLPPSSSSSSSSSSPPLQKSARVRKWDVAGDETKTSQRKQSSAAAASAVRTQSATKDKDHPPMDVEIIDLVSLASDSDNDDDHASLDGMSSAMDVVVVDNPTADQLTTRDTPCRKKNLRRVSRSPSPQSGRDSPSVASTMGNYLEEEQEEEEEGQYDYSNKDSAVGRCERICKRSSWAVPKRSTNPRLRPYPTKVFEKVWRAAEEMIGYDVKDIEHSYEFRCANNKIDKDVTDQQSKAMYGRILPAAMKKIFSIMGPLKKHQTFADLGHGVGNACLQASYTVGCKSKGIELIDARYFVSEAFHRAMDVATLEARSRDPAMVNFAAGRVELKCGRIEDPKHREWLSNVDAVLVNNFNEVFGRRSTYDTKRTIDDYIAALFASMKPGSVMVTMEPIYSLDQTQEEANAARRRHKLSESSNASFYTVKGDIKLGLARQCVSWSEGQSNGVHGQILNVHKYTRLSQENDENGAVFLCTNPSCVQAQEAIPIPATIEDEEGRLVLNYCPECRSTGRRKKRRNAPKRR